MGTNELNTVLKADVLHSGEKAKKKRPSEKNCPLEEGQQKTPEAGSPSPPRTSI